jgi:hypothetical protein
MKIIITESQLNSAYWKYLKYILGDLTEVHSRVVPENRFWKNDEYGVVLELEPAGHLMSDLWVHKDIWNNFSNFFSLSYIETKNVFMELFEEHLGIFNFIPISATIFNNL